MSLATVHKQRAASADVHDPRWDEASEEHRAALAAFLDAAERVTDEAFNAPWAPGKWTRAQVVEHIALASEAAIAEITTGTPLKVKITGWRQRMLRWVLLPHILFHRSLPLRARSPREIRPPETTMPRAQLLRRVRDLGERYEAEAERARANGFSGLTHPYFGHLPPVKAMRFMAVHIEHHTRQIARK